MTNYHIHPIPVTANSELAVLFWETAKQHTPTIGLLTASAALQKDMTRPGYTTLGLWYASQAGSASLVGYLTGYAVNETKFCTTGLLVQEAHRQQVKAFIKRWHDDAQARGYEVMVCVANSKKSAAFIAHAGYDVRYTVMERRL